MSAQRLNHFSLFSSSSGYIRLLEYDGEDGIVFVWQITKKYNICSSCKDHHDFIKCSKYIDCKQLIRYINEAQDNEFIETGDYEISDGYYDSIYEFINNKFSEVYPDFKTIPLGYFKNVSECREYIKSIKTILYGENL